MRYQGVSNRRIGDRDRERAIRQVKSAFVEGKRTDNEVKERIAGLLAARTENDIAQLVEDLGSPIGLSSDYDYGRCAMGERFVDPTTGQMVEVLYNQHAGKRKYVESER